jgi:hypothetical protein
MPVPSSLSNRPFNFFFPGQKRVRTPAQIGGEFEEGRGEDWIVKPPLKLKNEQKMKTS